MKNRDMPANAVKIGHWDGEDQHSGGLTKLEYAAIQIIASASSNSDFTSLSHHEQTKWVLTQSNALFDELEKNNETNR